jgi:hypothetical protein
MGGMSDEIGTISTRKNGDRLIGRRGPLAEELYAVGTPPVQSLAAKPAPSERVALVRFGDRLRVERVGAKWQVSDDAGVLGLLRWSATLDGKAHAATGKRVSLPERG